MKILLTLFLLYFSSSVFADDISDLQIEGMSIGDSALKFFTEEHIKKNARDYYNDKTFTPVQNDKLPFFNTYDAVDFRYKTYDKKYVIHSLTGVLIYRHNIEECYNKMDEIFNELSAMFPSANVLEKVVTIAPFDNNTKKTDMVYELKLGTVTVGCYDYSKESGDIDHLAVEITTNEFNDWLFNKAYN